MHIVPQQRTLGPGRCCSWLRPWAWILATQRSTGTNSDLRSPPRVCIPWTSPESYRNSGAGTAGLYSLLFDLRPCSPGARCRGPLPVLLAASRCIIQSHHSTQFLALNQQCALLFKKVKIIQFTDQASRRIQGIVDGFIIVLKEKGGGKETRLKRKSYVADSLEHFCSEPSEMFPVSLNSKG